MALIESSHAAFTVFHPLQEEKDAEKEKKEGEGRHGGREEGKEEEGKDAMMEEELEKEMIRFQVVKFAESFESDSINQSLKKHPVINGT